MIGDMPPYYFRIRENGALVFHIGHDVRHSRTDMDPIATVNSRNGEIRPQGDRKLTEEDLSVIRTWLKDRQTLLEGREVADMQRMVEQINLTTQWIQSRATDAQIDQVAEPLMMAMHDLRTVLVRKEADRLRRESDDTGSEDD